MTASDGLVVALAGGVGGAKLVDGLAAVLGPEQFLVAVNTGDDFEHLGLHISPDLDTVMYTLAGVSHPKQGWGLAGETFHFLDALGRLGCETWFRLGDRDLATHVARTERLRHAPLSVVTAALARELGVKHRIVPMSDDRVRTVLDTDAGQLEFQDYFVRRQCAPTVRSVHYAGIDEARPSATLDEALSSPKLQAVIICPSNPMLSIAPIIGLPSMRERLRRCRAPVVAVSPIIGGRAVKGPAAKLMTEMKMDVSPRGIVQYYDGLLHGIVIDRVDEAYAASIETQTEVTDTLMRNRDDRVRLARATLDFARRLLGS